MKKYNNILIAIDFSDSANHVIEHATDIAENSNAKLTLLHVVDHIPPLGFGEEPLIAPDWMIPEHELMDEAKKSLAKFCAKHGLTDAEQMVSMGTAANEIIRIATKNDIDLLILGSHGRHGVRLLLGSTANSVLHHALCDVLAVKIRD